MGSEDPAAVEIVGYIHQHPRWRPGHHSRLEFGGIYAHCGNSYGAGSVGEVEEVRDQTRDMMVALRDRSTSSYEIVQFVLSEASRYSCWPVGNLPIPTRA